MIVSSKIYKMGLKHREISVYAYLCGRANKKGECYPSESTIAKELSVNRRTVIRAIKDLKGRELLVVIPRKRSNGATSSNLYRMVVKENV